MKCIDNQAIVSQVWFVIVKKSSNFKEKQPKHAPLRYYAKSIKWALRYSIFNPGRHMIQ